MPSADYLKAEISNLQTDIDSKQKRLRRLQAINLDQLSVQRDNDVADSDDNYYNSDIEDSASDDEDDEDGDLEYVVWYRIVELQCNNFSEVIVMVNSLGVVLIAC